MTIRFCLHCNRHHESSYSCAKREAKRYAASAARKARGRHAWRVARRQQDRETASAAGSAARAKHSLFTTSRRSAKAANVMRCRT